MTLSDFDRRFACFVAVMAISVVPSVAQQSQFTTLYAFGATSGDGVNPGAPLRFDASGAL
jgi:hypothetical protein